MSDLAELIARLESATGGSWQLDEEIAELMGYVCAGRCGNCRTWFRPHGPYIGLVDAFTRSIDAALTLVPENSEWFIASHFGWEQARRRHDAHVVAKARGGPAYGTLVGSTAISPALALCIAALKARKATGEQS